MKSHEEEKYKASAKKTVVTTSLLARNGVDFPGHLILIVYNSKDRGNPISHPDTPLKCMTL